MLNFELDLKNARITPVVFKGKCGTNVSFNIDDGNTEAEITITLDIYKKIDQAIKKQLEE